MIGVTHPFGYVEGEAVLPKPWPVVYMMKGV